MSKPKTKDSATSRNSDADQGGLDRETEGVVEGGPKEGSTEKNGGRKRKAVAKKGESAQKVDPAPKKSKSRK